MNEHQEFYITWRERQKSVTRFRLIFTAFILYSLLVICGSILFGTLFIQRQTLNIAFLFIAVSIWLIVRHYFQVKDAKYDGFIKQYDKLLKEILQDVVNAYDKEYHKIFYSYEEFLQIEDSCDKIHIIKKIKEIPVDWPSKKLSTQKLQELAVNHIAAIKKFKEEESRRNSEFANQLMTSISKSSTLKIVP